MGQSAFRFVDFLQTFNDWQNPKNHSKSLFFFLLSSWTWQDFLFKKTQNFSDNSNTCLLLGHLMVWVLSVAHSDEHNGSTTQAGLRHNNWHLQRSSSAEQWDAKALHHHPFRGIFKNLFWFYIKKHLSSQHKQVNDKLVQSRRNLFNEFCHQGKYVFYETEIYINNR